MYDENKNEFMDNVDDTDQDESGIVSKLDYDISNYPSDLPLVEYHRKIENSTIQVPDFQRNYVWSKKDASRLIESFLIGLPVPGVFLYRRQSDNRLLVVDGQQRIMSAYYFQKGIFKDDKVFRLVGVGPAWEGKSFEELNEKDRRQIEDSVLRATIIQQLRPDDQTSIYHIFERLNTGGKNLTPMEVRRCIYDGEFSKLLSNLNELQNWRKLIGKTNIDNRYKDTEWILRIIALAYRLDSYEKPMKSFLTNFMSDNRSADDPHLIKLTDSFEPLCKMLVTNLGEKPFHLKGRLNYAAMDAVVATLLMNFDKIPNDLEQRYKNLKSNSDFDKNVSFNTSDNSAVAARFQLAIQYLTD